VSRLQNVDERGGLRQIADRQLRAIARDSIEPRGARLLHPLGLVLTAVVVVVVAAWAGHEFRFGEALISGLLLALISYALFVWGLNQTMPVWPWFVAA